MKRNRTPLLIAGALLLLASGSSATSSSDSSGSSVGKRPALPKPLGSPPPASSSSSAKRSSGRNLGGSGGDGVIEVTNPEVRQLSAPELAAMRARAAAPAPKTSPAGGTASGTVRASPELEPRHGSTPAGYNPAEAQARASATARHLATKGPKAYSRPLLKEWQTLAGLRSDGVYAGSSRGALVFYGVDNPPRPFAQPVATLPYHPPDYEP